VRLAEGVALVLAQDAVAAVVDDEQLGRQGVLAGGGERCRTLRASR
jgi:hypothetical protein